MTRRDYDGTKNLRASKKRTMVSFLLIFLGMPPILMVGAILEKGSRYMIVSLLMLIITFLPFFLIFENRRPKAREIVLIATMSSLTVFANLISMFTIPVHAGTALVIISGIAMGPEAGFLTGALSRFVCNFFSGHGPWTPWEMAAWGILGLLAGTVFHKVNLYTVKERDVRSIAGPISGIVFFEILSYLIYLLQNGKEGFIGWRVYASGFVGMCLGIIFQKKRLPVDNLTMPVFTFITVFIVYGGIMNFSALFMTAATGIQEINIASLKLLYMTGAPYDAIHAVGAAICVFVFGENMIRKVERIKIKYGMYK